MEDYNYLSTYGDFGSPTSLIAKKTVEDITANAPKELDTFKEVADKISELEGASGGSSADVDALTQTVEQNKEEADAKFAEIDNALDEKADASELASLADGIEYDSDAKRIYLKHGDEVLGEIDATQFIKDGMIDNVEIDGTDLVITFNEDAGDKETIRLSLASIFDASNYVTTETFNAHVAENTEAFAAINETVTNKLDADALQGYVQDANYVHTDNNYTNEEKTKLEGLNNYNDSALTARVEAIENGDYVTTETMNTAIGAATQGLLSTESDPVFTESVAATITQENINAWNAKTDNVGTITGITMNGESVADDNGVVDLGTVLTSFEETDPTVPAWAKAETKPAYTASEVGAMSTEHPANAITAEKITDWDNKADSDTNTTVTRVGVVDDDDAGRVLEITSSDNSSVSVSVTEIFDPSQYFTKTDTSRIFIDESEANTLVNNAVSDKVDAETLNSAVHELVVRLNKLEAQNSVLIEKGTDSADDINGMSDNDALNADIVVATDEAIEALSTPKTFNSISVAGGEVGDDTVINLLAKDSIDVNGLTVSGTKGVGNGKIVYGSNNITISNVNIEPGCTVYNVFEGKQDKTEDNLVENFTATNVIVNDTDLTHNVFNIYQLADGANILVKDSVFNLNVANSNIMRVSNITNAKNVTITFENVDWNYEEKGYTPADYEWAGLLIYQPYSTDEGHDSNVAAEDKAVYTWTINVKNCRYNGEHITDNLVGTIKQAVYQYDVNKSGASEAPDAFGPASVIFE